MAKRINVLPAETLRSIDRLVRPRRRSQALNGRLKAAALRDRDLDLEMAAERYAVDQEQWQRLDTRPDKRATPVSPGEAV